MTSHAIIQQFVNNFRRRLAPFLRPGVGLACTVHRAEQGGTILEFHVGNALENDDVYLTPVATVGSALAAIPQRAFGGNLEGFQFTGTNYVLEPDRIILIKDESKSEWTDAAAKRDAARITRPSPRAVV